MLTFLTEKELHCQVKTYGNMWIVVTSLYGFTLMTFY